MTTRDPFKQYQKYLEYQKAYRDKLREERREYLKRKKKVSELTCEK